MSSIRSILCLVAVSATAAITQSANAGTLPIAPPGQHWELQGTFIYTDTADGTTPFNLSGDVGTPMAENLDESLLLTRFDATGDATTHYCIVSSTATAGLSGSLSGIVGNLTDRDELAPSQGFEGNVTLQAQIESPSISGLSDFEASNLTRTGMAQRQSLALNSIATFTDFATGDANAVLNFTASGSNTTHDGGQFPVFFQGDALTLITSPPGPGIGTQPVIGTGSATYSASLVTVYEQYSLVPEPTGLAWVGLPALLVFRRRSRFLGQRR